MTLAAPTSTIIHFYEPRDKNTVPNGQFHTFPALVLPFVGKPQPIITMQEIEQRGLRQLTSSQILTACLSRTGLQAGFLSGPDSSPGTFVVTTQQVISNVDAPYLEAGLKFELLQSHCEDVADRTIFLYERFCGLSPILAYVFRTVLNDCGIDEEALKLIFVSHDIGKVFKDIYDILVLDRNPGVRPSQFQLLMHVVLGACVADKFTPPEEIRKQQSIKEQFLAILQFTIPLAHHFFCHKMGDHYPKGFSDLPEFKGFSRKTVKKLFYIFDEIRMSNNLAELEGKILLEMKDGNNENVFMYLSGILALLLNVADINAAALSTKRPYKSPISPDETLDLIITFMRNRHLPEFLHQLPYDLRDLFDIKESRKSLKAISIGV